MLSLSSNKGQAAFINMFRAEPIPQGRGENNTLCFVPFGLLRLCFRETHKVNQLKDKEM